MFKSCFKTAWRTLVKNKGYSTINILGLAAGMAVAILIGLWIYDEYSFNRQFQDHRKIARVLQHLVNNGKTDTWWQTPYPLADELRNNYGADFEQVVMSTGTGKQLLTYGDKKLNKSGAYFEEGGPDLLSLKMLHGSRRALHDPSSIFLSASAAKAFFGDADPINRSMQMDGRFQVKVAGVYEDLPFNSSFADLDFMASWELTRNTWISQIQEPWRPNAFSLYVVLKDPSGISQVSARIRDAKLKHLTGQLAQKKPQLFLFPMSKWHLYSEFRDGVNTGGRIQYVRMFGTIGLFVLLLACINFMNLSTARSQRRAREVGIRKAVGSMRSQLVVQFFAESLLVTALATLLAVGIVWISLPAFNLIADKRISFPWTNPFFWSATIAFCLITTLVAGCYPALYLSSFNAVKVLKGTFKAGQSAAIPRQVLVVLQFTVSVVLITGTMIVYRQIEFTKDRPLGYDPHRLVTVVPGNNKIHDHIDAVRNKLVRSGAIADMTESSSATTSFNSSMSGFSWKGKDPNLSVDFPVTGISYDYGKAIGWTLSAGRDFSRDFPGDTASLILNDAAVRYMNLKNPIGEIVRLDKQVLTVVGVVRDMVVESPYAEIRPAVYYLSPAGENVITMRLNSRTGTQAALASIESVFKEFNPEQPFSYQFTDEEFARKFQDEERVGTLSGIFAGLAIGISCLGLFGLAAFIAEQRTREVGVRKVLGASVTGIWRLLSTDFMTLVVVSLFIAIPLSWYFTNAWLKQYAYHAPASWWLFAAAALAAILIALITVSVQTVRAALSNPVRSIRAE